MGQTSLSESLRGVEAEIAAGRPDRALALCQELVTRHPRALAVQRVLGEVYLALRKSREALGALDRALAGNPEDARACCARAIVNQIQGDTMAALAWYRRACDISPDDQVLRSAYREIASHLQQPPYRPSHAGLARLYLRGDLFPHAAREWETLLAEQPDALEAQVGLAETLWRAKLTAAAADRCRRILNNVPSCVKVLLILAAIEYDAGNGEEAQRLMRQAGELDPDQRIGQALFADRFAAGDRGLRALLQGEPLAGARDGRDDRASSKPLAGARPFASSQPLEQAARVTGPLAPLPSDSYSSTTARPSGLPPDFHTIFAETEYMLWSRDEEAKGAAGSPSFEQARTDTVARAAGIVPPVLREQGGSMDDTDARAAINWINWLQAQGARPRDPITGKPTTGPLTGAFAAHGGKQTPNSPAARGATGSMAILPPTPTGPLPPPSPEALRAMFAELGPEAGTSRVVEGELVPSADTGIPASAPLPTSAGATGPLLPPHASAPPAWTDAQAAAAGWSVEGALPESLVGLGEGAFGGETASGTPSGDGPVVTLEALERRFSDSGFTNVELHPGDLASIAADRETERLSEHASPPATEDVAPSWPAHESVAAVPEEPAPEASLPEAAAPEAPAPSPPEPSATAADDYPGRLEYARRQRDSGRLDDALTEYRAILKNAPDLLPELVAQLQDSLAEAPDHPEIHRLLGDVHIRQGDYLSALEAYNRAVALTEGSDN